MKKIILLSLIVVAAISINAKFNFSWSDCVKEEGDIVRREISIDSFDKLHLNGSPTVFVTTGKTQKVEIETTQNIIDILKTKVTDGEWSIGFKECIKTKNGVKIYVDAETIKQLSVNGSGDFIGKNTFETDNLSLRIKGSGDIKVDVNANKLTSKIQGSGDIKLSGKTKSQTIVVQGSGDYTALDLTSDVAEANVNGSGDIQITVMESLTAKVNGSGDIIYFGKPAQVDSKVNGSGDITAK